MLRRGLLGNLQKILQCSTQGVLNLSGMAQPVNLHDSRELCSPNAQAEELRRYARKRARDAL